MGRIDGLRRRARSAERRGRPRPFPPGRDPLLVRGREQRPDAPADQERRGNREEKVEHTVDDDCDERGHHWLPDPVQGEGHEEWEEFVAAFREWAAPRFWTQTSSTARLHEKSPLASLYAKPVFGPRLLITPQTLAEARYAALNGSFWG